MNGKRAIFSPERRRVPERDRGIGPVDEPDVRQRDARQPLGRLVQEHPREVRGPERLAPRAVRGERDHRPVRVADVRVRRPVRLVRRIERVVHEAVGAGQHAVHARRNLAIQPDRRAERPARHFEAADECRQQRARPDAFVAAPAVVDRLAEAHRDRAVRHADAVDLDRLADVRVVDELVGDPADRCGGNVADRFRPFRRIRRHVGDELAEPGFARRAARRPARRRRGRFRRRRLRSGLRSPRRCPACRTAPLRRARCPRPAASAWPGRAGNTRRDRPDRATRCAVRGTRRRAARAGSRAAARGRARTGTRRRSWV